MSNRPPPVLDRPMPHRSRDFQLRGRPHYGLLAWLLLGLLGSPIRPLHAQPASPATPSARATPPGIYLWGISQGDCKIDDDLSEATQKKLERGPDHKRLWPISRLRSAVRDTLPACSGPEALAGTGCAQAMQRFCPTAQGWLLGGRIVRPDSKTSKDPRIHNATRIRLWLYDLQNRRRIVQDDYCQFCNSDTAALVATHAHALLAAAQDPKSPRWEPLVADWPLQGRATLPTYCGGKTEVQHAPVYLLMPELPEPIVVPAASSSSKPPQNGTNAKQNGTNAKQNGNKAPQSTASPEPISLTSDLQRVRGELKSLLNGLNQQPILDGKYALGRQDTVIPWYRQFLAEKKVPAWRIVMVTVDPLPTVGSTPAKKPTLTLTLADAESAQAERQSLPCKESCEASIKDARGWLRSFLSQCFASQCAGKQEESAMSESGACQSFPSPSCDVQPLPPFPKDPQLKLAESKNHTLVDWLRGASWSAAGLALVTAGGLGIADLAGVALPNRSEPDKPITGAFQPAIVATFSVGVVLAGVALGSTIASSKQSGQSATPEPSPAPWLQCPAQSE